MKLQSYPKYKDSGIERLGQVPKEWMVCSLKRIISAKSGVDVKVESGDIPLYGANGVIGYSDTMSQPKGALLIGRVGSAGELTLANEGCAVSDNALIINSINSIERPYIFHLLKSLNLEADISKNAQPLITATTLLNKVVPIPLSKIERVGIAAFLDREIAKLDTLIAKQEKLIKLLQEKRQAIISHAVTKGLDSNVKMKDSGVEWLGKVPEHWEVLKGKNLFEITKRIAGKLGYDVLSITQKGIKVKDITSGDGQLSMDYSKYQLVEQGDFAMNHMDLLTGFVDISNFNGVTSPDYRVFKLKEKFKRSSEYYLFVLQNCYREKLFFPYGQGSSQLGRWRLPTEVFNYFNYPSPSLDEQLKIVRFLKTSISRIDLLISKSERSVELAKEHRTALISAAITGKIDVREYSE